MKVDQIINGFKVIKETELKDINSVVYEMEHLKSGAKLCFIKNDDNNKTFSITFKTLPSNDTGVFHILEHCVLNGSKKYPVKEPFVELLKSSMQTFLNAMTSTDYTAYPISSRNDKDFMNLMSVYLDAVFNPLLHENPNIFYQEGWHYEVDEDNNLTYNGVVFNEMKGAYSSIDDTLINNINKTLFPNNCYQYDGGGNPENITDLSYEEFVNTHKKYYHPSNSKILLDGDIKNLEEILAFIDEEYLSKYDKQETTFEIDVQEEVEAKVVEYEYELNNDEPTENRTVVAITKIVSNYDEVVKNMAWQLLANYLVSNNDSKFTKAILDSGLAEDVEFDLMDGCMQPWAVLVLRNTEKENIDKALDVLKAETKEILKEGLNKKKILSSLYALEFKIKEKSELSGLMHASNVIKAWNYGDDPTLRFHYTKYIEELKKKLEEGYFEKLLEEFILSDNLCTIIAKPSHEIASKRIEKEKNKLANKKEEIGDITGIIELNEKLIAYQQEPNSEEALNTLPKLTLEDVGKDIEDFPHKDERIKGVDVLNYQNDNLGISYLNLYFNLAGIKKEQLPYIGFFHTLFGRLDTENYTVEDLQSELKTYVGALKFALDSFEGNDDKEICYPTLSVQLSFLNENIDKTIELVLEMMQKTVFSKEKILPILKQDNEFSRQIVVSSGHALAMSRVNSHISSKGVFAEYTLGNEYIKWLQDFDKNYEDKIDEFIEACNLFKEILFAKDRLTISTNYEDKTKIEKLISSLSTVEANKANVRYPLTEGRKEKYVIPGGVSYVGFACRREANDDPLYLLLMHSLTYDYLWNEVRVKNGAYGSGSVLRKAGLMTMYSYRDPNPINTIEIMENCYKHFEDIDENTDITSLIIGALSSADPLLTTKNKILTYDSLYFRGITYEERMKNREAILKATAKDLKDNAEYMKQWLEDKYICVVGNAEALNNLDDYTDIKGE